MGLSLSNLVTAIRNGADDVGSAVTGQPAHSTPKPVPTILAQGQNPMAISGSMPGPATAESPANQPMGVAAIMGSPNSQAQMMGAPDAQGITATGSNKLNNAPAPIQYHPAVGFYHPMQPIAPLPYLPDKPIRRL